MHTPSDPGPAAASGALVAFVGAALLVAVRGPVGSAVIALALACLVVVCGWIGGRAGGIGAATMAAAGFDFFHTRPYLSLKISDTDDLLATVLLLFVGLAVGTIASWAAADRRQNQGLRLDARALSRVLAVAAKGNMEDLELSVRAELLGILRLDDCWFTPEPTSLPTLGPFGELALPVLSYRPGGFELPHPGVAIPVLAEGRKVGSLVCLPTPGVGVSAEQRRVAVALAGILGLASSPQH